MTEEFLPNGYVDPVQTGNYMKLEEGDNTFRVLSSAITGWEIWGEEVREGKNTRVPYRFHLNDDIEQKYQDLQTENNKFKVFWAFVVFNRDAKKIQILEVTQNSVRKALQALVNNKKWGNPKDYDIVITKNKTGPLPMDVEYIVTPDPKEAVDPAIVAKYKAMNINLDALYKGEDPFSTEASDAEEYSADEVANSAVTAGL